MRLPGRRGLQKASRVNYGGLQDTQGINGEEEEEGLALLQWFDREDLRRVGNGEESALQLLR